MRYVGIFLSFFVIIFLSCAKGSHPLSSALDIFDREFPASMEIPEGNDAFSSSNNYSSIIDDPRSKASGLSGAAFIPGPAVNNFGAVEMSCGIHVPAGRAGMAPSVSLSYSSNAGDGLVGVGWNLCTGVGSISRSLKNGEICYDSRDTFLFNGRRLVKTDGLSGENGTYRLEIES